MAETQTKSIMGQDAEKAQDKRKRPEPSLEYIKALADDSIPFAGLLGVSAMELPLERHASLLGDPRFSHSANNSQKARMVTELQQNYGNAYVQRVISAARAQKLLSGKGTRGTKNTSPYNAIVQAPTSGQLGHIRAQEEDPIVTATLDFGPNVPQPHWAIVKTIPKANFFARQASAEETQRQGPKAPPAPTEAKVEAGGVPAKETQQQGPKAPPAPTTAKVEAGGVPAKETQQQGPKAPPAPTEAKVEAGGVPAEETQQQGPKAPPAPATAKVEAGGVQFEVTAFNAIVAGGLNIKSDAKGVSLASQPYVAAGTVKATGPKSRVGEWDVGFLQTVYKSSRNSYYDSKARTKVSDVCIKLPVRDGERLKQPWYGPETVSQFVEAPSDTQLVWMGDQPSTYCTWDDPKSGEAETLHHTDGEDVFRSWLAVRNRTDYYKKYLRFADWQVDYRTAVLCSLTIMLPTFPEATPYEIKLPPAFRVTPAPDAGAKVTGMGEGMGGKQPELFDPVANDVAKDVYTKW